MCYCKTVVIFQVSVSIKYLMNSHNVEFFSMSILVFCLTVQMRIGDTFMYRCIPNKASEEFKHLLSLAKMNLK